MKLGVPLGFLPIELLEGLDSYRLNAVPLALGTAFRKLLTLCSNKDYVSNGQSNVNSVLPPIPFKAKKAI